MLPEENVVQDDDFTEVEVTQKEEETKESTDVVSGSDRLVWLCSSFSIFKKKSDEEIAEDQGENGNRKLVPVVTRHGAGLDDYDYINIAMLGDTARIIEKPTRNELKFDYQKQL